MTALLSSIQLLKNRFTLAFAVVLMGFMAQAQMVTTGGGTNPNTCDGYAYLDTSQVQFLMPIVWMFDGQIIASDVYGISNLCPGTYIVTYYANQNVASTETFTIGPDQNNPCAGFALELSGTDPTTGLCDGEITSSIVGGTAPFVYSWSNNSGAELISDLCAGSYSLTVTDALGCSVSSAIVLDDGTITSDTVIVIINSSFPVNAITDTLPTVTILDCDLDFDAIETAGITNVTYDAAGIMVTWTIWDVDGNVLAEYDIYYYNVVVANGVFQATLIVFCDGRSNVDIMVHITDQFEYNSTADLTANEVMSFSVVNPFNDVLEISFSESASGFIHLIDLNGRILMSKAIDEQQMNLNTSNLSQGMYLLQVQTAEGVQVISVLK